MIAENQHTFPYYEFADINALCNKYSIFELKELVKEILEIEAPLSEDLLLKYIVPHIFNKSKVTESVKADFARRMHGCNTLGIRLENGFWFLDNGRELKFRAAKSGHVRQINLIAPEELAVGMLEIIKWNTNLKKSNLYKSLASFCGVKRVGQEITRVMESALGKLGNKVVIDNEDIKSK